jgi:predicted alpha/beta hydrolase family esterase
VIACEHHHSDRSRWTNAGPQHWLTLWEQAHPEYRRVEQRDWDTPERVEWIATLDRAIRASVSPPILVAHSLGCIAIAHWAGEHGKDAAGRVSAALLVAPADVEAQSAPQEVRGFRPVPLAALPFPSVLVASRTDRSVSFARATRFAQAWGSSLVDAGDRPPEYGCGLRSLAGGRRILMDLHRVRRGCYVVRLERRHMPHFLRIRPV